MWVLLALSSRLRGYFGESRGLARLDVMLLLKRVFAVCDVVHGDPVTYEAAPIDGRLRSISRC